MVDLVAATYGFRPLVLDRAQVINEAAGKGEALRKLARKGADHALARADVLIHGDDATIQGMSATVQSGEARGTFDP